MALCLVSVAVADSFHSHPRLLVFGGEQETSRRRATDYRQVPGSAVDESGSGKGEVLKGNWESSINAYLSSDKSKLQNA